jgi:tRNA A-37 threonylcarbamoyl transferase component Bud32
MPPRYRAPDRPRVAVAHARGIVHGISSRERLRRRRRPVKILDFGLATLHDAVASQNADTKPAV